MLSDAAGKLSPARDLIILPRTTSPKRDRIHRIRDEAGQHE